MSLVYDISRQDLLTTDLWNRPLKCRLLMNSYVPNAGHESVHDSHTLAESIMPETIFSKGRTEIISEDSTGAEIVAINPNYFHSTTEVLNGDAIQILEIHLITEFVARPIHFESTTDQELASYVLVETMEGMPIAVFTISNAMVLTGASVRINFLDDLAMSYENDFSFSLTTISYVADQAPDIVLINNGDSITINTDVPYGYMVRLYRAVAVDGSTFQRYSHLIDRSSMPYTDTTVVPQYVYKYQAAYFVSDVISPKSKPVIRNIY